jgi:hypothetical protein
LRFVNRVAKFFPHFAAILVGGIKMQVWENNLLILLCQKTTGSFMFHFIIRNPY